DRLNNVQSCDVDAIWNAILTISNPESIVGSLDAPPSSQIVPLPRPKNIDDRQTVVNAIGVTATSGLALGVVAILAGVIPLGVAMLVLSVAAAAAWFYFYRESPLGKERAARGA